MSEKDTFKTIIKPSTEVLFKDKNSKFFGYAFPVDTEDSVKTHLADLRKVHYNAGHFCYAYQIGTTDFKFRANDDGEPNNSAGQPIFGQIQSHELTNILIVVVRYFGGTKLGVGGLINAYKTAAQLAIEASKVKERTIDVVYKLVFEYKDMNKVMRKIKENQLNIVNQEMDLTCRLEISVRKSEAHRIFELFDHQFGVNIVRV
ncbi:MAG: YigZ family protein [Bacteroidia bacterium]|nr:YigZ family protein [Bacteroidia bacterium]NND26323.1 YigZ family protein [Flavobacteriaceae bacterium]MBT8278079.1 YigZ family protein [Bacteroidia bacterium]NNK59591.1 YigZ family protein [Flavobacteriaceae bacterium]NNL33884.1 YigZ family protein [Flavobacteriaceae bacterium]